MHTCLIRQSPKHLWSQLRRVPQIRRHPAIHFTTLQSLAVGLTAGKFTNPRRTIFLLIDDSRCEGPENCSSGVQHFLPEKSLVGSVEHELTRKDHEFIPLDVFQLLQIIERTCVVWPAQAVQN